MHLIDSIKWIQLNGQCKRKIGCQNSCFDKMKHLFKKLDVFNFRPTFYYCILRTFFEPFVFDGLHRTSRVSLHQPGILFIPLYSEMASKNQRIEKTEEFINLWTYSWIFVTFFQTKFLQKRAISSQLISSDQPGPNPDGSFLPI